MTPRNTTSTKFMVLLGLPSLGLSFAVTALSAYLPSILHSLASPVIVGLIIGAEGFFGLFMPIIVGGLADKAHRAGERLRYLLPSVIAMAAALILMGLITKLYFIGAMVALFYLGYYTYLAPYWALYPDLIPDSHSGRSRSAESIWRGFGAMAALVSSGFLLDLWRPLPFITGAVLIVLVTLLLRPILGNYMNHPIVRQENSVKESFAEVYTTIRKNAAIRNLVIANSLWNAALRSILAFTVLFFTVGMGRSHHFVSGVIFPIAAIGLVVMMPLAGKLADKFGFAKVLTIALVIYGVGDLLPVFSQSTWVIFVVPLVAAAAATVMVLPYALLMRLLDGQAHGMSSGLFGVSRGIGSFLGPLLTGIAVELGQPYFSSTKGYAAFWLACGVYVLASIIFVWRIYAKEPI